MEALRTEYKQSKLKIINVCPGGIDTTFWRDNRHYVPVEKSDRFMNPVELAAVIYENIRTKQTLTIKDLIIEKLK